MLELLELVTLRAGAVVLHTVVILEDVLVVRFEVDDLLDFKEVLSNELRVTK